MVCIRGNHRSEFLRKRNEPARKSRDPENYSDCE